MKINIKESTSTKRYTYAEAKMNEGVYKSLEDGEEGYLLFYNGIALYIENGDIQPIEEKSWIQDTFIKTSIVLELG